MDHATGNSQRARLTALNAYGQFAEAENFTVKKICEAIAAGSSGDALYIVLDNFAMHLAFKEKGYVLATNTVASYVGNVKFDLLEVFPALQAVSSRRLQKMASILDKYCEKRGTDFTHQAPSCTKSDLGTLLTVIYEHATSPDDYKDAALLNLLWYLLSRSSDTCLYIYFKRMKSASTQGASLFLDLGNVATYLVHTLAVATIMQATPSEVLLNQLPRDVDKVHQVTTTTVPRQDLLVAQSQIGEVGTASVPPEKRIAVPEIQAYVNRFIQNRSAICGKEALALTKGLISPWSCPEY
ncbi:hypothetical protein PC110_g18002 [Phytophthora cactorum]|uniref:Uncharacterized protein n=1 Tax=Phytophthora cactorum TaxID=29920 RepID=A0A329RML8_9STRA|nr:hypothetical protein PC110_g18002 [Phytophthora cactorum]